MLNLGSVAHSCPGNTDIVLVGLRRVVFSRFGEFVTKFVAKGIDSSQTVSKITVRD